MDKAFLFLLNVFLNSFLAFFTSALLIEMVIFLFRIKLGRISAVLRMIPILKMPIDLCLYDFSRWSYLQGVNPLLSEEGTRSLSVWFGWMGSSLDLLYLPLNSGIEFSLGKMTFTLADLIGSLASPKQLKTFSLAFVFLCLTFFLRKIALYRGSRKMLRSIAANAEVKKIHSSTILISEELQGSPFVAGLFFPKIYMPSHLAKYLSKQEYEAILAHELEHIRKKDIFVRLILELIASLFWWIPTKWLRKKIAETQEISCDAACKKYGVNPVDLASAIHQSAKYRQNDLHLLAHYFTQHKTCNRIKILLASQPLKTNLVFAYLAIGCSVMLILLGRFWIF